MSGWPDPPDPFEPPLPPCRHCVLAVEYDQATHSWIHRSTGKRKCPVGDSYAAPRFPK